MDTVKRWLKRGGQLLVDYTELILALVAATVVIVLGATGDLKGDHLTEATLGVIGALALGIIGERSDRLALADRIEEAFALTTAVKAWRILDDQLTWDLIAPDGSHAIASANRQIQFMQDEVVCIYEYQYSMLPGEETEHEYRGGAPDEPMDDLSIIQRNFPGEGTRIYRLISLERVWYRGEIMNFKSKRVLKDRFPSRRENVAKDVPVPTARMAIRVIWPTGIKPRRVWIQQTGHRPKTVKPRKQAGRWRHEEVFVNPPQGNIVGIWWEWEGASREAVELEEATAEPTELEGVEPTELEGVEPTELEGVEPTELEGVEPTELEEVPTELEEVPTELEEVPAEPTEREGSPPNR